VTIGRGSALTAGVVRRSLGLEHSCRRDYSTLRTLPSGQKDTLALVGHLPRALWCSKGSNQAITRALLAACPGLQALVCMSCGRLGCTATTTLTDWST
jgi:hypothetical protein